MYKQHGIDICLHLIWFNVRVLTFVNTDTRTSCMCVYMVVAYIPGSICFPGVRGWLLSRARNRQLARELNGA